jgi:hypothetical protein
MARIWAVAATAACGAARGLQRKRQRAHAPARRRRHCIARLRGHGHALRGDDGALAALACAARRAWSGCANFACARRVPLPPARPLGWCTPARREA